MKSYDFDAMVYDGDVYCIECLGSISKEDAYPIFADSEWEYAPVCSVCGAEHDYVTVMFPY